MKKTLVSIMALSVITLSGCNSVDKKPTPQPVPSVSVLPTETDGGMPTPPNITRPPYTPEPTEELPETVKPTTDSPTVAPTTSGAVTPAVEFAGRWGKRYPDIPEFAILKAANGTCRIIAAAGQGWEKDPLIQSAIKTATGLAGLSDNDALEFAQDANQNYCSSVANPT